MVIAIIPNVGTEEGGGTNEGIDLSLDGARVNAIRQATYQIEAMVEALIKTSGSNASDSFPWMAQGIAVRVAELNGAIMNAIGDEGTTDQDLYATLWGPSYSEVVREEVTA